jgi:hypothetical protein
MTEASQSIALAREYARGARSRPIDQLPPSRLMAELAETRRQLGLVIGAVGTIEHLALTEAQRTTVLDALDVAAGCKRGRAADCPDCEASPSELYSSCEYRLARADEYDALAKTLRGRQ